MELSRRAKNSELNNASLSAKRRETTVEQLIEYDNCDV